MILKCPNSRLGIVNLLSDFILSKIPKKEKTKIQVIDMVNFVVIKGKTSYNQILDITLIKEEFIETFKNIDIGNKLKNTIDLIEYDCKMEDVTSINCIFFKNDFNCSYHNSQITDYNLQPYKSYDLLLNYSYAVNEDNLYHASEFPHGYSMNQGRSLYYYGKKIFYTISHKTLIEYLRFRIGTQKNEDGEYKFSILKDDNSIDEKLTSAVLDSFDFQINENEVEVKGWFKEVESPLTDHEGLKLINKDFILF